MKSTDKSTGTNSGEVGNAYSGEIPRANLDFGSDAPRNVSGDVSEASINWEGKFTFTYLGLSSYRISKLVKNEFCSNYETKVSFEVNEAEKTLKITLNEFLLQNNQNMEPFAVCDNASGATKINETFVGTFPYVTGCSYDMAEIAFDDVRIDGGSPACVKKTILGADKDRLAIVVDTTPGHVGDPNYDSGSSEYFLSSLTSDDAIYDFLVKFELELEKLSAK